MNVRIAAVVNTDPNDEIRVLESTQAAWEKLHSIQIHCRAGKVGRWGDTGLVLEKITPEEIGDQLMEDDDTAEDYAAKVVQMARAHREKHGPHIYQFRFFKEDKSGDARHDKPLDVAMSLLKGAGDFGTPRDGVQHARSEQEAATLVDMHKMYIDSMKANLALVVAVTKSPLVTGQAEIRKLELTHDKEQTERKYEREDDAEIWDIGKQFLFHKLGIGSMPTSAANTDPRACDWAKTFANIVGDKAEEMAEAVAPDKAKEMQSTIEAAFKTQTKREFREQFDVVREAFETHPEPKSLIAQMAKTIGPIQMLEFQELIEEVLGPPEDEKKPDDETA